MICSSSTPLPVPWNSPHASFGRHKLRPKRLQERVQRVQIVQRMQRIQHLDIPMVKTRVASGGHRTRFWITGITRIIPTMGLIWNVQDRIRATQLPQITITSLKSLIPHTTGLPRSALFSLTTVTTLLRCKGLSRLLCKTSSQHDLITLLTLITLITLITPDDPWSTGHYSKEP